MEPYEINASEVKPITRGQVYFLGLFVISSLLFHATAGWFWVLDNANLAFHEAGHPIFGMLWSRAGVYGGTLMQLIIPAVAAYECRRQDQPLGWFACWIWFAENLLGIARYMADARAHLLPLVGGVDPELAHDWTEIFSRWNVLQSDTFIAGIVRIIAVGMMLRILWNAWQEAE